AARAGRRDAGRRAGLRRRRRAAHPRAPRAARGCRRAASPPDGGRLRSVRARAAHRNPVRPRTRVGPDRGRLPARDLAQAIHRSAADRRGEFDLKTLMDWRSPAIASDPSGPAGGGSAAVPVGVDAGATGEEGVLTTLPETLPVLPLKNTVLFPFLLSPLLVNTARSKRLIDHVLVTPERLLIAPAVRRPVEGSPGPDDVYEIATVLRIV